MEDLFSNLNQWRSIMRVLALLTVVVLMLFSSTIFASDLPTQEECESDVEKARDAEIITGISVDGDGVHVTLDLEVWLQSTYENKLQMAAVIECAIAGPGKALRALLFHDPMTNKVIGEYRLKKLKVM